MACHVNAWLTDNHAPWPLQALRQLGLLKPGITHVGGSSAGSLAAAIVSSGIPTEKALSSIRSFMVKMRGTGVYRKLGPSLRLAVSGSKRQVLVGISDSALHQVAVLPSQLPVVVAATSAAAPSSCSASLATHLCHKAAPHPSPCLHSSLPCHSLGWQEPQ